MVPQLYDLEVTFTIILMSFSTTVNYMDRIISLSETRELNCIET